MREKGYYLLPPAPNQKRIQKAESLQDKGGHEKREDRQKRRKILRADSRSLCHDCRWEPAQTLGIATGRTRSMKLCRDIPYKARPKI